MFPAVPQPESLSPELDAGIDLRSVPPRESPPGSILWARMPKALGDDPRLHACALAFGLVFATCVL